MNKKEARFGDYANETRKRKKREKEV